MRTRPKSDRLGAALPAEDVELIRPYLLGEANEEEAQYVEELADTNPAFAKELERRRWLLEEMDHVYGERKITDGFQQTAERKLSDTAARGGIEDEEYEEEFVGAQTESFIDSLSARFGAAPWWMVSGALHALVILLATLIGMAILRNIDKETVIVTDLAEKKEVEEIEEPKVRDILKKPVPIEDSQIETDQTPIVTHEEVEISDVVETDNDSDANDTRGEDGISDVWLGGSGTVAALGLGGGGGGAFGRPNGAGGRLRRAIRGGGGRATESAVDKALEWLARHQHQDGSWHVQELEGTECWDPGVTALATLAFLGAGHTEKIGKYKNNVKRALDWIMATQKPDGSLGYEAKWYHCGGSSYNHAICGMALAEAYAMARNPKVREAAQKAITYTTEVHQCGKGQSEKYGWRYKPKTAKGDMSNVGWFVMQLKSSKVAGLDVNPASFEGAARWLDTVMTDPANVKKVDSQYDNGKHRYGYSNKTPTFNTTSMGVLCRLFMGVPAQEVQGAARWLLQEEPPRWEAKLGLGAHSTWPMYYTYYTTLVTFQVGGEVWKEWNNKMKAMLLANQRKDGDFDGSWDVLSAKEKRAGRAYSTAMGAMCLEVYYRYLPMYRE